MPAPGEVSLPALLSGLSPRLDPVTWIYLHFDEPATSQSSADISNAIVSSAKMMFREVEGLTAIIPFSTAVDLGFCDSAGVADTKSHPGLQLAMPSRLITLEVQSSLEAVGMMAVIARELAHANVPCNVVAGFLHDHLFVPVEMEQRAMEVLVRTQQAAAEEAMQKPTGD